jgi:ribosome-binding protein aMBF1 (putative translation factor)
MGGSVPILGANGNAPRIGSMTRSVHKSAYGALRERLRVMRMSAGLSQRALAKILRVPHSWVAKVESGERRLDVVEFMEFADACGADACDALGVGARPVRTSGEGQKTRITKGPRSMRKGGR